MIILLFTAALCVLRMVELSSAFELLSDTEVVRSDVGAVAAMRFVTAAGCVIAVVLAAMAKGVEMDYERFAAGAGKTTSVIAGFLLAAAGGYGVVSYLGDMVRLVLSLFAIFAGAGTVLAIKAKGGAAAIVPVFLGCFLLLTLYVEHAGDAVLERYGYAVLGAAAYTSASYCAASASFRAKGARAKMAASGVCVMLCGISALTFASEGDWQMAAIFAAAVVFAAGECLAICFPKHLPKRVEE